MRNAVVSYVCNLMHPSPLTPFVSFASHVSSLYLAAVLLAVPRAAHRAPAEDRGSFWRTLHRFAKMQQSVQQSVRLRGERLKRVPDGRRDSPHPVNHRMDAITGRRAHRARRAKSVRHSIESDDLLTAGARRRRPLARETVAVARVDGVLHDA